MRVRINPVSHSLRGQTGSYVDFLNFLDAEKNGQPDHFGPILVDKANGLVF